MIKRDRFNNLKQREDFKEAVWMHTYHQQIQNKKIEPEHCPICQTPATWEIKFED